jgi:hypothetical protein
MSAKSAEKATAAELSAALFEIREMLAVRRGNAHVTCAAADDAGAASRRERARARYNAYSAALADFDHITAGLL